MRPVTRQNAVLTCSSRGCRAHLLTPTLPPLHSRVTLRCYVLRTEHQRISGETQRTGRNADMRRAEWGAFVRVALSMTLILAGLAAPAVCQTDQARITGTVRDSSNAVMPGATVTVRSERTGEAREAVTNEQGRFLVAALRPASYTISVT